MNNLSIKKLIPNSNCPGYDLYTITENYNLPEKEKVLFKTGLKIITPNHLYSKNDIKIIDININSESEICVVLTNLSKETINITRKI